MSRCELKEFVVALHELAKCTSCDADLLCAVVASFLIYSQKSLVSLKECVRACIAQIEVKGKNDLLLQID